MAFWNLWIGLLDRVRRPTLLPTGIRRIWLAFAFCALAGLAGGISLFALVGR